MSVKINIILSVELSQKFDLIKAELGVKSNTEVIRYLISTYKTEDLK